MNAPEEFYQYTYPQRELGDNAVYCCFRGDVEDGIYIINVLGNKDKLYIATNNDADAIMIALKFG